MFELSLLPIAIIEQIKQYREEENIYPFHDDKMIINVKTDERGQTDE